MTTCRISGAFELWSFWFLPHFPAGKKPKSSVERPFQNHLSTSVLVFRGFEAGFDDDICTHIRIMSTSNFLFLASWNTQVKPRGYKRRGGGFDRSRHSPIFSHHPHLFLKRQIPEVIDSRGLRKFHHLDAQCMHHHATCTIMHYASSYIPSVTIT